MLPLDVEIITIVIIISIIIIIIMTYVQGSRPLLWIMELLGLLDSATL